MKRGNKKGQFYLIAAIIISLVIIGFANLKNYSTRQSTITISNFGEELQIESENVLDFGTYNGYSSSSMQELMKNLSADYINYVRDGEESYFLFGDNSSITVRGYSETEKTIYVDFGSGKTAMEMNAGQISSSDFTPTSSSITLTIEGKDYLFALKSGKNFYFILFEKINGDEYAIRN
jgi:hypothetical protein